MKRQKAPFVTLLIQNFKIPMVFQPFALNQILDLFWPLMVFGVSASQQRRAAMAERDKNSHVTLRNGFLKSDFTLILPLMTMYYRSGKKRTPNILRSIF